MKPLFLAILLATTIPVQAQQLDWPKTITFHNNVTKEKIGTATISGNSVYFRDKAGVHYATLVREPDGKRTLYDPSGNVLEQNSLALPTLPE